AGAPVVPLGIGYAGRAPTADRRLLARAAESAVHLVPVRPRRASSAAVDAPGVVVRRRAGEPGQGLDLAA
ncbi:MAG: hypothetical protein WA890_20280, partial [Micromonospora sp.]